MKRDSNGEAQILSFLEAPEAWIVKYYDAVDSTMDLARDLASELGKPQYGLVVSRFQNKGRGRHGRSWESPKQGLYFTLVLRTKAALEVLPAFTLVTGLRLKLALGVYGAKLVLKWPNDLLDHENRKVAGILIENIREKTQNLLLVGIGVNIVGAPKSVPHAAALADLGEFALDIPMLLGRIGSELRVDLTKFEQQGFVPFRDQWIKHGFELGRTISLNSSAGPIKGEYRGVSELGELLIFADGRTQRVVVGEICY